MGGYALYVWTAYGLVLIVLVGMVIRSLFWHRDVVRRIRREPTNAVARTPKVIETTDAVEPGP